jgi:hypothetical protein
LVYPIEAAVVKAHPEWCLQGKVGEEIEAFSDFLVYTLDSPTLLSDWAIVVISSLVIHGRTHPLEDK